VAGKAGLKAGLIGLAVMLVMTGLSQVLPMTSAWVWVSCGVSSLLYAGIGVLAGFFLAPPRTTGKGARIPIRGAGAIAGLISSAVSGVVSYIIIRTLFVRAIRLARGLDYPGLTTEQMQQLAASGMDPKLFAIPGVICSMAISAGLAAIGGAIGRRHSDGALSAGRCLSAFAAVKSD